MKSPKVLEVNTSDRTDGLSGFSKDSIAYGIAVLVPALIGILSISIYTRLFSVAEFGQYNQVYNTTLIVTTLFSQWIQQSIQRYRPLYKSSGNLDEFNKNLTNLLVLMLGFIMILGGIGSLFRNELGAYKQYYWISLLLIISQFLFLIFGTLLQADFKSRKYKNFNVLTSILKFGFGLIIVYNFYKHPISIIFGLILGQIILLGPMFKSTGLSMRLLQMTKLQETIQFTKQFALYGFPMIGWFIGNSVLNLSDRYMLEALGSIKDVGIYSANYSIVSASLGLLAMPLVSAAHPIIMNKAYTSSKSQMEEIISSFARIYMLFSFPLLAFVSIFHTEITALFLGEEFRVGSIIIPILFLGLILWNLAMIGHKGYEIKEKTKVMLSFVVIAALVNLLLNYLLIPDYGYVGASIATLASMAVYPALIKVFSYKFIRWKINISSTIKITLASAATALLVNLVKRYFDQLVLLQLIIGGVIGLILYLLLLFILKELSLNEMKEKAIKKFLKR
ncbi:lipopolysaccharide biosynthesis protein [Neobacillus vireti]|uniref:lipopolysaccharide biosynthesis protein n=1 Tax=Neobacillus vireti TaxID=220686 RepID=UPI003000F8C3